MYDAHFSFQPPLTFHQLPYCRLGKPSKNPGVAARWPKEHLRSSSVEPEFSNVRGSSQTQIDLRGQVAGVWGQRTQWGPRGQCP